MAEPGETIGRYRVVSKLGRGTMGTVYEAVDRETSARVAVKVMAQELADDEELVARFRREAMAAAALQHPNITQVYDFGEEGRQLYMAMELLKGQDLKVLIESGGAGGLGTKIRIMEQVASGIAAVHAVGLVHRDLKPGNIHVTPEGRAKIMDFGLVRLGDSNMTATGMVLGSPAYMSPEQLRGEKVDARSDVFSLGAVFYELLAGQRAFGGKQLTQIMMAVMGSEPVPLAQATPGVPAPVRRVIERCLRKNAAERYQTGGELHAALDILQAVWVYSNPRAT